MSNQYAKRDHLALGEHYLRHVSAMTGEGLHAKSDIAAELAWRDAEIERLRAELFFVLRGDGLEHLYDGDCPASNALHARDPQCPACKRLDELAATEARPVNPDGLPTYDKEKALEWVAQLRDGNKDAKP